MKIATVILLIAVGLVVYGLSLALDGFLEPLAGMLLWMGNHAPCPASAKPFAAVTVLFVALRLLAAPLQLTLFRPSADERAFLFALLLAVLDGIVLFLAAQAAQAIAPAWLAHGAWLPGAKWAAWGKVLGSVGLLAGAAAAIAGGFHFIGRAFDSADLFAIDFEADSWSVGTGSISMGILVYLPVVVALAIAYRASPFVPAITLSFCLVKVLADLSFAAAAVFVDRARSQRGR
jgi:hypothetical protein